MHEPRIGGALALVRSLIRFFRFPGLRSLVFRLGFQFAHFCIFLIICVLVTCEPNEQKPAISLQNGCRAQAQRWAF